MFVFILPCEKVFHVNPVGREVCAVVGISGFGGQGVCLYEPKGHISPLSTIYDDSSCLHCSNVWYAYVVLLL